MKQIKHYALDGGENSANQKWFQKLLSGDAEAILPKLNSGNGAVFSDAVLDKFIEEDHRHGRSKIAISEGRSLRTFSSGEKRKVLLNFLLKQNPEFLILDSPFDNLDKESVADLKLRLEKVSETVQIIQIFKRKEDILPFIDEVLEVEGGKVQKTIKLDQFLAEESSEEVFPKIKNIPKAPAQFEDIPEVLVKLEKVSVNYEEHPILANISWEIKKGQFWKLTGPNGSGKTTILSMIYGDNPKAYGENVYLFGNKKGSGESVWEIKKKIGYFSPALTELFHRRNTVLEMVVSGLMDSIGLYQKPNFKDLVLAKEWLKTLQLEHQEKKVFVDLPLLQQRMLLIARAMIKHPPLLILDEPTSALDDKSTLKITNLINIISAETETAVVYVSHRKEKGLKPEFEFKLIPSENGSVGEVSVSS
ncbi:ATP-binding cassette domain-containing protein [Autumnicola edwardsiae]|uniref:ATP-binding cassette domain-containing protein n=1 Tax=Autumnicola edwardsiae TaxID=3075594 RepID=A0ABU3CTP6_9FLAO|nr:ATP-binding cassette domain-containing protein [Zunongwangia sp. F297]MDT0649746.1 ATP-binding cassette domain-containing protein [Zunongwangia sp. F297]